MKQKSILVAIVALGAAAWTLAQAPGGYSNAPTDKDFRMMVKEPLEGATITGKSVDIVLGQPWIPTGQGINEKERRDTLTPIFQIWVDGKDMGNVPSGQNVFTASDLPYGPHKITVVAKNTAGEAVDRKEINITTVEAASETTAMMTRQPAAPQPVAAPAPAAPPAPAPAAPAPATPETLPQTGSSAPTAAVAGLGLLAVGLALRRRA